MRSKYSELPHSVPVIPSDGGRVDLGDDALGMVGKNCRPPGKVASPITLTILNESDPVVWAEYDTDEIG
jgi:hypothetical protein